MAAPNSNYAAHIFSFLAPMAQKGKKDFLGTPQTPAEGAPSALPWMFLVALLICSFLLLYLVPTAHAASGGRIAGQLLGDAEECACGGAERYFADGSGQHFTGFDYC